MITADIVKELGKYADPEKAIFFKRFFKTGKGEYGENDVFLGISVPPQRAVAKKYYREITVNEIGRLLRNRIHEYRLTALMMLIYKYRKADEKGKKEIFDFYLSNTGFINNWDLVDLSAPWIVGNYLSTRDRSVLFKLAKSDNLWQKRIAMLSTYWFIKNNDFADAIKIAEILLLDRHDLIQKAVGWMLREIGKKDIMTEEKFLNKYYSKMPRTALRYAIEKFDDKKRAFYMKK